MSVAILGVALWAVERIMPAGNVTIIQRRPVKESSSKSFGRRIEHARPPDDIARLRSDEVAPNPRGLTAFIVQSVFVAVSSLVGRKVFRLRVD